MTEQSLADRLRGLARKQVKPIVPHLMAALSSSARAQIAELAEQRAAAEFEAQLPCLEEMAKSGYREVKIIVPLGIGPTGKALGEMTAGRLVGHLSDVGFVVAQERRWVSCDHFMRESIIVTVFLMEDQRALAEREEEALGLPLT